MQSSQRTVRQVKKHQRHHNPRPHSTTTTRTQQNFWLTNYGSKGLERPGKAKESLVQGLEVLNLLAKMYGVTNGSQQQMQQYQQEQYNMYGMHGENSTIPGATSATSSPTMLQQPHDLYGSNGGNLISSLRTHSSKFPIERELILSTDKNGSKIPLKQYPRQIPTTPIAFQRSSSANGNGVIQQFLPKSSSAIAPDHPTPKQFQAWNAQEKGQSSALTGAIPRTPSRMPEDVTALAEREMGSKDGKESKNAVTKTYHTLKDLISSKFKKDSSEMTQEELNNVTIQQQATMGYPGEDMASPYYALMQQQQILQQQTWHNQNSQNMSQAPQMWNGRPGQQPPQPPQHAVDMNGQQLNYSHMLATRASIHQQRTLSQPQLNLQYKEVDDRRGSLANIDVTDSDEGGFANKWRPTTQQRTIHGETPAQQILHLQQQNYLKRSSIAQQSQNSQSQQVLNGHYHNQPPPIPTTSYSHQQQKAIPDGLYATQKVDLSKNQENLPPSSANSNAQEWNGLIRSNQEKLRASFQQEQPQLNQKGEKQVPPTVPAKPAQHQTKKAPNYEPPPKPDMKKNGDTSTPIPTTSSGEQNGNKQIPGSAASSDYDKSGNHSSNVDSGRGSAAYSSGRKATIDTSPDQSDTPVPQSRPKSNDSEWIDIVDAELRHILEPGLQNLSIRPESTISGSLSSISPPLPPLSPDGSLLCTNTTSNKTSSNTITNKISTSKMGSQNSKKPEYGTDSYNRPGKNKFIGPSRGLPGSILQKRSEQMRPPISKKQEQSLIKRHLFGLDDMTSTTTRSLDLDSLLGGPWGGGQSVSDSETDTQGLRHIKSQLEGLETMYSEVLKMLGARPNGGGRGGGGPNEGLLRNARRRQGSLSSLPSSSVSGRPIRDRRRNEERRKVRDIKGINKRFQRLESHVVTLARSVAHLSSEMRSQHLVTQELEGLRQDLTNFRMQSQYNYTNKNDMGQDVMDGPNLTNPKRVKKLTKFFGEDPPLMRLFLKKLGYEKYAPLFETERVGMIELPYLGEERLQKLGVPLGPRLRILQEAQISLCKDKTLCIV